jgi:succinyl-CoA synthetase beta subunit
MYSKLGLPMSLYKEFSNTVMGLYKIFTENDVSLIEINPLAVSGENTIIALDAKIVFDDNALFRLGNIMSFLDQKQENPREIAAQKHNLSYIALEGEIGCLVNGAGLAMSTMDIIKHVGGSPANFLDVGGSATEDNVKEALKIILNDDKVKSILINVFGGIAKCDVVAAGIINAAKEINITVPLIVRLEGTNVEKGQKLLNDSNLKIIPAFDLLDAAQKAVKHIENQ